MIHALFENLPSFFMMALFGYQAIMLRNDAVLDNDHFQHSMEEGSDVEDVAEVTIVSTTINTVPKLSLTDCWRVFFFWGRLCSCHLSSTVHTYAPLECQRDSSVRKCSWGFHLKYIIKSLVFHVLIFVPLFQAIR